MDSLSPPPLHPTVQIFPESSYNSSEKISAVHNNLPLKSTDEISPIIDSSRSQTVESVDSFYEEISAVHNNLHLNPTAEISENESEALEDSDRFDKISTVEKSTAEISPSVPPLAYSPESLNLSEKKEAKRVLDFGEGKERFGGESMDEIDLNKSTGEISPSVLPLADSSESLNFSEKRNENLGFEPMVEISLRLDESLKSNEKREAKRVLDFGGESTDEIDLIKLTVEISPRLDESLKSNEKREAKRVLDFGGESTNKFDLIESTAEIESKEKNKKNKKKRSRNDEEMGKSSVSRKRIEQKERQMYLQQLHVESQKLLRETRDATFKPIPVVHKPISYVLEKIRKRKLEVMKKTIGQNNNCSISENDPLFREVMTNDDTESVSTGKREADKSPKVLQDQTVPCKSNSDDSLANELEEASTPLEDENSPSRVVLDEQPINAFRAPLDDTQDLFCDSPTSEGKEDMSSDQNSYPLEEEFAPSLLAMNLKFDSAPPDDISSDEDDNDKENVNPGFDRADSPKGDPVKAFLDEEAEEEDNSDNDMRFNENEEEDFEDYEELKDLIATGYEENPVDNDMRNELHQKWLEQQDATGTDNLMQRLKYGSKLKQTSLLEDEQEEDIEDDEDFYDEPAKDPSNASMARTTIRKAKQMIPQLFSDKNDCYLSDEEEAEKRLTKRRVLDKVEVQSTLVPPTEDENSREVFGLIKKLNIMSDTKKKAKTSSIFDKMLIGAKTNGFSKSSFLGRKGNHSLPSSTKKGTSTIRSFIFGRDDSNSRSSLSVSEDSSDVIMEDTLPTKNVTTKFSSSQYKFSSQFTKSTTETSTNGSLFNILKRSSVQSSVSTVGLTQTVFDVFKIPKKSLRIE